jgi:hypothetical protein
MAAKDVDFVVVNSRRVRNVVGAKLRLLESVLLTNAFDEDNTAKCLLVVKANDDFGVRDNSTRRDVDDKNFISRVVTERDQQHRGGYDEKRIDDSSVSKIFLLQLTV